MAIADTITSMQTHTSNAYDMLEYGTDLIGTNKNLENLSKSIFKAFIESLNNPDTLWGNLPKITGTGTNITLNNTIEAPMKIELSPVELTQDGTPTPSSPQAVHSISGSNKVVVNGKNLLSSPFTQYSVNTLRTGLIYIESGTYTFNCELTTTSGDQLSFYKVTNGTTELVSYGYNRRLLTATLESGNYFIEIYRANILLSEVSKAQLEKGSTATTYEPYNSTDYSIDLKSKNLFDGTGWRLVQSGNGYPQPLTGATIVSSDKNNLSFTIQYAYSGVESGFIKVKANETYTLSFNSSNKPNRMFITQYDENKTRISTLNTYVSIIDTTTFTTTNDGYIAVAFTNTTTSQTTYEIKNIMIEKGSTQTEYAEYYDYGEYCKIGNYEDKFIRTSGKNLFDGEFRQGSDNATNNAINVFSKNNLLLEAGTYTFSCNLPMTSFKYAIGTSATGFPNPASFIDGFHTTSSFTFTLNEKLYVGIMVNMNNNNITPNDITSYQFQIEKSSSATEYEPYGSNEWYIKNTIPEIVLNGSELGWEYAGRSDGTTRYFQISNFTPQTIIPVNQATTGELCDKLIQNNPYTYTGDAFWVFTNNGTTQLRVGLSDTTIREVNDFRTWLASNNISIWYPLATPTYTPITGTLAEQLEAIWKAQSKDGTTNISQVNNDLAFGLSAQAIQEL